MSFENMREKYALSDEEIDIFRAIEKITGIEC